MVHHSTRVGLSLCAVLIGSFSFVGCDFFQSGTTRAYTACLEEAKRQDNVTEYTAKAYCANEHSAYINQSIISASIEKYSKTFTNSIMFEGYIHNNSKDKIITSFTIVINGKDSVAIGSQYFEAQWIEPNSSKRFILFGDNKNIDTGGFSWSTESVKGLKITF